MLSSNVNQNMTKLQTWLAGIGGLSVVLVAMVWGVPSYLNQQVGTAVAAEITAREALQGKPQEIIDLEQQYGEIILRLDAIVDDVGEVKTNQIRLEGKQDDFGLIFLNYLQRQAQ